MKNRIRILVFASLVLFMLLILPTFAHHGNAGYDNRTVTIKRVVTLQPEWFDIREQVCSASEAAEL